MILAEFRKNVMSRKFPPAILGPEMAAPILWAHGIFWFFLLGNPHAHNIPPFRGECWVFFEGGGGGSANCIFMGVGIFPMTGGFRRLPRKFSHCGIQKQSRGSPEVSQTSPEVPRTSPGSFPDFPGGQPLSLGNLTPSPDSQRLSLNFGAG